jgi:hypothetical protein
MAFHLLQNKPTIVAFDEKELVYPINKFTYNILICDDGIYSGTQMEGTIKKIIFNISNSVKETDRDKIKLTIHVVCPYMTKRGKQILSQFGHFVTIYNEQNITMLSEILSEDKIQLLKDHNLFIGSNASPIYMDHRMPDFMSSIPDILNPNSQQKNIKCGDKEIDFRLRYIIDNCVFSEDLPNKICPNPIYKNEYRNETDMRKKRAYELTPKQFLNLVKLPEYQRVRMITPEIYEAL